MCMHYLSGAAIGLRNICCRVQLLFHPNEYSSEKIFNPSGKFVEEPVAFQNTGLCQWWMDQVQRILWRLRPRIISKGGFKDCPRVLLFESRLWSCNWGCWYSVSNLPENHWPWTVADALEHVSLDEGESGRLSKTHCFWKWEAICGCLWRDNICRVVFSVV